MHHADIADKDRSIDWVNTIFLVFSHTVALGGLIYSLMNGIKWQNLVLALVWFACAGLSITGGYHRLFSHKTYRAAWPLRLFYALFGAASVQNSVIAWSSDHRRHHADTDEENDPYNSLKGFWWSHMGWVFYVDPDRNLDNVKDLYKDPIIAFQHKYYVPLAVLMIAVVPGAIGMAWGDPIGAIVWAGFIRLVFQYHSTFSINSLAHMFGRRPYNNNISARDNGIVAIITLGEGYHNFHHQFPGDYRNGVRAWQFDPTKWIVKTLSYVGVTKDLRRVSQQTIDRAKLQTSSALHNAESAIAQKLHNAENAIHNAEAAIAQKATAAMEQAKAAIVPQEPAEG